MFVPQCWDNFLTQSECLVRSILWCNGHMFFSGTCVCTVEVNYVVLANSCVDLWPLGSSQSSPPLMHIQFYKSSHGLKMFTGRFRKNSFHRPGTGLRGHVLSSRVWGPWVWSQDWNKIEQTRATQHKANQSINPTNSSCLNPTEHNPNPKAPKF